MAVDRRVAAVYDMLACVNCRSETLIFDEKSVEISCQSCRTRFKIVNGIPAFVPDEVLPFSELAPEERAPFLAMKSVAYSRRSVISWLYNSYHRFAARKRGEAGGKRLTVDVGFGVGEHYPFITETEKNEGTFIGVDLDRFKLEQFSTEHPEIPLLQASALRLPFAAGSVDVVQLLATLEHFTSGEISALLDEALRILKSGGLLIACYPAEGGLLLRLCQRIMHRYLKMLSGFDLDTGAVHHHLADAVAIRAVLSERGELERLETCFYPFGIRSVNLSLFVNELYRKR